MVASWPPSAKLSCKGQVQGLPVPLAPEPGEITTYSDCQSLACWRHPLCGDNEQSFPYSVLNSRILLCPTALFWDWARKRKKRLDWIQEMRLWALPPLLSVPGVPVSVADKAGGQCWIFCTRWKTGLLILCFMADQ